jgi:predicted transcriptional regulator
MSKKSTQLFFKSMFQKEHVGFLNISDKENKILFSIHESPKSILQISAEIKIPRATLYPIVKQLEKRGWVMPVRYGKKVNWQAIPPEALSMKIFSIAESLIMEKIDAVRKETPQFPAWLIIAVTIMVNRKRYIL